MNTTQVLAQKYQVTANKLAKTLARLMDNPDFIHALPSFIDAAKKGILFGHKTNKPDMVKVNSLSLVMFEAIKGKKPERAYKAAESLVKLGHGKTFGLI